METYEEGSLHCSGYLSGQHQTHGMAWHGKLSSNYTLLLASATQSHSDLNDLQVRTAAAMHKADQMGNGSRDGTEQHSLSIGPACNTAISRKNTCVAFSCVAIEGSFKSDNAGVCATVLVISCIGCLLSSASDVVFCRLLGTCNTCCRLACTNISDSKSQLIIALQRQAVVLSSSTFKSCGG